jgi:hypothetical protein
MQDRRKEQRWPALLGGTVEIGRGFATASCTVRNTSASGARLKLNRDAFLPEEFDLAITARDMSYRVRRKWRRDDEIGVEIARVRRREAPVPLKHARRIRQLQDENAKLRDRLADLTD